MHATSISMRHGTWTCTTCWTLRSRFSHNTLFFKALFTFLSHFLRIYLYSSTVVSPLPPMLISHLMLLFRVRPELCQWLVNRTRLACHFQSPLSFLITGPCMTNHGGRYDYLLMSWGGSEENPWFQLNVLISMLWLSSLYHSARIVHKWVFHRDAFQHLNSQ